MFNNMEKPWSIYSKIKHSNPAILRHDASFITFFVCKGNHDVFNLFFFLTGICYEGACHLKKKYEANQ